MPNPGGKNSPVHFNGLTQNPPAYGDKQRQGDLARTVPAAGGAATASALEAPRRAKREAVSGGSAPVSVMAAPPEPVPAYGAVLAQTWAEIAQHPGASPLVQQLAQEAQIG